MGTLGVIGVILVVVLCIAVLIFLALVGMDLIELSAGGLVVLTAFLALVIIAGAIWAIVAIPNFP